MRILAIAAALSVLSAAATAAEPAAKASARTPRPPHAVQPGKKSPALEKFSCSTGPNDEQVRLIVEAVKGRAMEFAFYSRLGTRVCSIHSRRGDGQTNWEDAEGAGGKALVRLRTGNALLEYEAGHVKLTFSNVERMPYCGMYGDLNGVIEAIIKKPECGMQGLFEGANEQEPKPKPAASAAPGD